MIEYGETTNRMKKEGMLEDLLAAGQRYKAHRVASKRSACTEPSSKTKTIEDPATLSHAEVKTQHTERTSIT